MNLQCSDINIIGSVRITRLL